ncbi:DNA topoisomerase I [Parcubacteria bacterium SG8_24]|nr:MAG: DNA topoisomerase I [Parcubacteria bacterium SG8_24]
MKKLIIVESPTKAKTISKFLGRGFAVLSSFGHIRDLPKNELGVDTEKDFRPRYIIPTKSRKVANELKKAAKGADAVYFASDEDREGEAIAWHLSEILGTDKSKPTRISFHEITAEAVTSSLENPRGIDMNLVDAQQARRILDRLVGYELSPFLWRKVARGLSAGRVQSVIVRLIVEREREIEAFKPREYWSVEARLRKEPEGSPTFEAKLLRRDGKSLDKFALGDAEAARQIVDDLTQADWKIASIERKKVKRSPLPPFITSTLQQEANNRLGFSAKQTMTIAQQLYEGMELGDRGSTGLITYMRTDSVSLADKFIKEARALISGRYGQGAIPSAPRRYKTKSRTAQEAHEAIRPTDVSLDPESVAPHLNDRQRKLYELIWRRAVASQMVDAELATSSVDIDASHEEGVAVYTFRANGSTIARKGFLEVYETETKEAILPELAEGEAVLAEEITPKQHFTEPPPRYTEASLVKTLEENGIGRPSTYAPTISTVLDRGYVEKEAKKLKPTELGLLVTDLLIQHFPDIVDFKFTARMEEDLDMVASGDKKWVPLIREFYVPFKEHLTKKDKEISKKDLTERQTDEICESCGKPMVEKIGRYGRFLACTGFPKCRFTKPLEQDGQDKRPAATVSSEKCPECGEPMMLKQGKYGSFMGCSQYPKCRAIKPILKKVGVKCPSCGEGDIIEKRTRKSKVFYACSRYPDCTFALWSRPVGENCPECGGLMVVGKGNTVKCSGESCDYEREVKK